MAHTWAEVQEYMADMKPEDLEKAMAQAFDRFLEKKYAELGVWSFRLITIAVLGALFLFWMKMNGWKQ
jgi:hypothetical protein